MPSISSQYTPLESLLFLQLITRNGPDFPSLSTISCSLSTDPFVQSHKSYDAQRLAPDALRILYRELLNDEEDGASPSPQRKDAGVEASPRRHRLSPSLEPLSASEDKASRMIDLLYTRYRERIIQQIKDEEKEYQGLVADIETIREETKTIKTPSESSVHNELPAVGLSSALVDPSVSPARDGTASALRSDISAQDGMPSRVAKSKEEAAPSLKSKHPPQPSGQMLPPQTSDLDASVPHSPSAAAMTQRKPSSGPRVSPAPPNGIPGEGQQQPQNLPTRHGPIHRALSLSSTKSPLSSNALPPISTLVPQPLPLKASPAQKRSPGSGHPRTSALLPSPSPPYQPQPPYGYQYPSWPQYNSPNSPYANHQFYHQQPLPPTIPPAQTPVYNHYQPYHHAGSPNHYGPVPFSRAPMPSQAPQNTPFQWPDQPASASTLPNTPSVRRLSELSGASAARTSTPWRAGAIRHRSPERPDRNRDVSPLSDRAASPEEIDNDSEETKRQAVTREISPKDVAKQVPSPSLPGACSANSQSFVLKSRSRSQSAASTTPETRLGQTVDMLPLLSNIKDEAPSTPAPFTTDSEQRSPERREGQNDDVAQPTPTDVERIPKKRKRESGTEPSLSPSVPTPRLYRGRIRPTAEQVDPSVVSVTKNFARMAAPILNGVDAHRFASIFAKPLTEREAPGYKDLIYRPQDLKSIRAAVGRGSRAANAVIDELEPKATSTLSGSVWVSKTEDLVPPKGIINSAQLEMEFMRLFANAIMFNPLPPSERGLPPEFQMQKDGRPRGSRATENENNEDIDGENEEKKGYAQEEEGGIIHDTRDMFESVEKAVAQWRSVEQGYIDDVPRHIAGTLVGLRGGSVTASDTLADESAQEEGDPPGTTTRKRRRIS